MQKRYPFKFLDAYTREDSDFFFGRAEEVAQLYEMVFQTDLLLVYGASGTGKTSLIQCGLANKFQSHDWLALNIRRGGDLNASLDQALQSAGGDTGSEDLDWLDDDLSASGPLPPATGSLSPLARRLKAIYLRHFKPLYLIFDQFEELYILGGKAEEQAFVETVREILRATQPVKIILSIREEYLGHLYEFERAVPELLRKKLRVEPMSLDRVATVLQGISDSPRSNVQLQAGEETALTKGIFEKIRGEEKTLGIPLPYLQVFLDKLYLQTTRDESRQVEAVFTLAGLNKLGDIGDVLRNFLDEQVLRIATELGCPPEAIWKTLSPFVTLDGTKDPLSVGMLQERLPDAAPDFTRRCLEAFQQGRILRFDERTQRYEIAHDSLARQIHAKRSDEEIALLEVQRLIRSQVAIKAEAREYFTGKQLDFVAPYLPKLRLTAEERDWITESERKRAENAAAEERRQREELESTRRRLRVVRGLLGLALVAVLFAGYFAYESNRQTRELEKSNRTIEAQRQETQEALDNFLEAERQRKETEIGALLTRADNFLNLNQQSLAIQALQEALQIDSTRQDIRSRLHDLNTHP